MVPCMLLHKKVTFASVDGSYDIFGHIKNRYDNTNLQVMPQVQQQLSQLFPWNTRLKHTGW